MHVDVREVRDNCGFAYTGRGQIMNLSQISGHAADAVVYGQTQGSLRLEKSW